MNVEIRDDRFNEIVGSDVEIEQVATGFIFTEGPVWNPVEKHLVFSDIQGDILRKWTPDGRVETFRQPSNMSNGNCYDRQGRLITCEHATSRVTRTEPDGSVTVLATHYDGKELNSPNDVVVRSDGSIYFTDPYFGRLKYHGVARERELDFCGVYRLDPETGALTLLVPDFTLPNGLCFSVDESQLFVDDSRHNHIRVFDVQDDGSVSGGRVWAKLQGDRDGVADGMKTDSRGNLYCSGPGGIHCFAPDETSLGIIYVPEVSANFTWGDEDLCSLFITASTSLYRVRVIRSPASGRFRPVGSTWGVQSSLDRAVADEGPDWDFLLLARHDLDGRLGGRCLLWVDIDRRISHFRALSGVLDNARFRRNRRGHPGHTRWPGAPLRGGHA